jgi:hypothetical protein
MAEFPQYPNIVDRASWGGVSPNNAASNEFGFYPENPYGWRVYDSPEIYRTVVIHHSVVYAQDDASTLREIQELHQNDRGWADIAYHYLVGKNGLVYAGRAVNVRGAHVGGYNTGSVGVCLLGDFTREDPTNAQIQTTAALVQWLGESLPLTHLAGHYEFNPITVCPGYRMIVHLDDLATQANLKRGTEGYSA